MAYFQGDVADLDAAVCAPWVESGHMVIIPETEGDDNELPEDIPARNILFKYGLTNLEDVKKVRYSLDEIKGISKKTAEKIKEYLETVK